ncbi:MAG: sugar ABC transporter ATP-binding protein [Bifidobacteriaceae bacterium]|jgi:ribose transport system ATP-binding protein|nr:sugar ABC transporter ATP-binding protein [Bifidobacteriaceae bacterium]
MAGPGSELKAAHGAGLSVRGIIKRYAGVPALDGVDATIRPGQILGLVGHNGAGKSTLIKVLSGAVRPDEGTIAIDGRRVSFSGPADAIKAGIATVYQELSLLENLTVTQNVHLGHELTAHGTLRREAMRTRAEAAMERLSLKVDVTRTVASYPVAVRQLMEIAIAIDRQARFLLLDEPTTSLEGEQINDLLALVKSLATKQGIGVGFISHKLDELYRISDRVVALVDGKASIDGPVDSVPRAQLVAAIAGSAEADPARKKNAPVRTPTTAPSIAARHVATPTLEDVSLTAYPGQVLGLYGLIGSGRTEFLRALLGLDPLTGGKLELFGQPYRPTNPAKAAKLGLAYVTEERKASGIVAQLDPRYNVALPILGRFAKAGILNLKNALTNSDQLLDQLRVLGNRKAPVMGLSGGNQQKVVLARALGQNPKVLALDEPTKGVDNGDKVENHRIIRRLAETSGLTVLLVSSEEEEILDVADAVSVFQAGHCDGTRLPVAGLTVADLRQAAWAGEGTGEDIT